MDNSAYRFIPGDSQAPADRESESRPVPRSSLSWTRETQVVTQRAPVRPPSYLILAIFTTVCCHIFFGAIAIIFSVLSSSSADVGYTGEAQTRGRLSLAFSIIGIVTTIICVIVALYFVLVVVPNIPPQSFENMKIQMT